MTAPQPASSVEWGLRAGGVLVGLAGGAVTGVIEALYSPLRVGTARLPVSPVLAAVTNLALLWFTYEVTRRRGLAVLPGIAWLVVMIACMNRTTEGDLIFAGNNWMALVTIGVGMLAWLAAAYRLMLNDLRRH